ncbi:MAG: hypothetical protein HY576_03850 [candidate division NC10 bacterium]|nr:hypothetical protein [candidate division NC10 bacterium]
MALLAALWGRLLLAGWGSGGFRRSMVGGRLAIGRRHLGIGVGESALKRGAHRGGGGQMLGGRCRREGENKENAWESDQEGPS